MDWSPKDFSFETRAIHAGQEPDPTTGAIMTPLYLTSTYVQESPGKHKGFEYSRTANPTRKAYEACLANLEGAKHGFAFASGCAATTTILHILKAGDHVIAGDDMYGGTYRLFEKILKNNGIEFDYVDLTNLDNFDRSVKPNTRMVWVETPTNPLLKIIDIKAVTERAKTKNIISAVDNTFMSPYFQQPISLGADIVMHSTTKFINGHSDIVGGACATSNSELAEKIAFLSNSMGTICAPFDAFMCMRSLKTLAVRMKAHEENGKAVAKFLANHNKVERIIYPGLDSHPQFDIAKKQMSGAGGMITFYIKGGLESARIFLESVRIFALAESLGGVESLIEHPAIMTHASVPSDMRKALGIDDNMIRLSVGIESKEDLLNDLSEALNRA